MSERLGPYKALEHRFMLEISDQTLESWCRTAFRHLRHDDSGVDMTYTIESAGPTNFTVHAGDVTLSGRIEAARVLPLLMTAFNRGVSRSARQHLVLHAGVVGFKDGVILLPGPSGSGKSTMVAAAGRLGHTYGADEHAAIRLEDALAEPIPKPVALKHGSSHLFADLSPPPGSALASFFEDQLLIAPDDLGGGIVERPAPVVAIVLPTHHAETTAALDELGKATGLMRLREEAFNFGLDPEPAFAVLTKMVRNAPVYELRFGDAAAAWKTIFEEVG